MVKVAIKETQREIIERLLKQGFREASDIRKEFFRLTSKNPDSDYIRKIKRSWLEANPDLDSRRNGPPVNSTILEPPAANPEPQAPAPEISAPVPEPNQLIAGEPFVPETGEGPEQEEAQSLADSYKKESPAAPGAPIQSGPPVGPRAEEIKTPEPEVPKEAAAVDLSMLSALPRMITGGLLKMKKIAIQTDNYEIEPEDAANIDKYTRILIEKHADLIVTKYAEELNWFAAIGMVWFKAMGRKIAKWINRDKSEKQEKKVPEKPKQDRQISSIQAPPPEEPEPTIPTYPAPVVQPGPRLTPEEIRQIEYKRKIAEVNRQPEGPGP